MNNLLNVFYNSKLNIGQLSSAAFGNVDYVSVIAIELTNMTDKLVRDVKYISVHEGTNHSFLLPFKQYIINEEATYIILINHPMGQLTPSSQDIETYRRLKKRYPTITSDVIIVSKDSNTYVSLKTMFENIK